MTSKIKLGQLEPFEIRDAFPDEAKYFTPWLAEPENLVHLGNKLNIRLEPGSTEESVGDFRADIVCTEASSGATVLIENQLNQTDNIHLGQIILYAAGLDAVTVVWIARKFLGEHRAALGWLNEKTDPSVRFYGVEIGLWTISGSEPAPNFNIVVQPENEGTDEPTDSERIHLAFWSLVNNRLQRVFRPKPGKGQTLFFGVLSKYFKLRGSFNKHQLQVALNIDGPNSYDYAKLLEAESDDIEEMIGAEVSWKFTENGRANLIFLDRSGSVHDAGSAPDDRDSGELASWMASQLELFREAFADRVKNLQLPDTEPDGGRS